jgi:hypothetical protein
MSEVKETKAEAKAHAAADAARTADEIHATQAKKLTDDERKAADKKAKAAKKAASEEFHAERIKREHEHHKAHADKLYLGRREVKFVRKAEHDDIGYMDTEGCSVVQYLDDLSEIVVQDADIKTQPTL